MKLTVFDTSMFNFDDIDNEDGGLVFNVEQYYSDSHGFEYIAICEEFNIVILYNDKEEFDTELNDDIVGIYTYYGNLKDSELTQGAIKLRDFGIKCFTEWKK